MCVCVCVCIVCISMLVGGCMCTWYVCVCMWYVCVCLSVCMLIHWRAQICLQQWMCGVSMGVYIHNEHSNHSSCVVSACVRCDIYEEKSPAECKSLITGFLRFVEILNKLKKSPQNRRSKVSCCLYLSSTTAAPAASSVKVT